MLLIQVLTLYGPLLMTVTSATSLWSKSGNRARLDYHPEIPPNWPGGQSGHLLAQWSPSLYQLRRTISLQRGPSWLSSCTPSCNVGTNIYSWPQGLFVVSQANMSLESQRILRVIEWYQVMHRHMISSRGTLNIHKFYTWQKLIWLIE
jgi:hypothetical protein